MFKKEREKEKKKATRGEKFSQIPGPDADVHDVLWIKCSEIRFSKRAKELITRAHSRGKILTLGEPGNSRGITCLSHTHTHTHRHKAAFV